MGKPTHIQPKKSMPRPASASARKPMRFGGVPTGVPSPPMDAPHAIESTMAARYFLSSTVRAIERPMGNTTAVAAALLIHIDITKAALDASMSAPKRPRAHVVTRRAKRAPKPCKLMASAIMKLPMNKNRMGLP